MDAQAPGLYDAAQSVVEALLIGFLIGAQREASHGERHPGVRDFVLIALTGGVCGLLQNPWLTVASLVSITALLGVYYFHISERAGITTEMAAIATFALGVLVATPASPLGAPLAIGIAVVVVAFLEAKRGLHTLLRETITETEFDGTLRFLALIFIIYPILPEGAYGPYQFFSPRRVWLFVILVSSISFLGYFLEKFLGARRGLRLAAVFGGLASTTAATASFARSSAEQPGAARFYSQATILANAIQFPRVLAILYVVNTQLAQACLVPLGIMAGAGLALGLVAARDAEVEPAAGVAGLRNPFRLLPALQFGGLFALILLVTRVAAAGFGQSGFLLSSALGGSVDVDAVAVSTADFSAKGGIAPAAGALAVILALAANAVLKSALALSAAGWAFTRRLAEAFAVMIGAGILAWLLVARVSA